MARVVGGGARCREAWLWACGVPQLLVRNARKVWSAPPLVSWFPKADCVSSAAHIGTSQPATIASTTRLSDSTSSVHTISNHHAHVRCLHLLRYLPMVPSMSSVVTVSFRWVLLSLRPPTYRIFSCCFIVPTATCLPRVGNSIATSSFHQPHLMLSNGSPWFCYPKNSPIADTLGTSEQ